MDDLISRQAVIDILAAMQGRCTSKAALIQNSKIWQQIKDFPSAQPERQKAIWALRTYMPHHYYCTHCKKDSPYNKTWSYCPNCGCEMEGYV